MAGPFANPAEEKDFTTKSTKDTKKEQNPLLESSVFTFVLFVSFVVNEASWLASLRGLLLTALVQTKRRFEEESVNLHVNRIVDAHADDATDLLGNGK